MVRNTHTHTHTPIKKQQLRVSIFFFYIPPDGYRIRVAFASRTYLERLDLLVHEVELLLLDVQRRLSGHLASLAIVEVVVVEADDGRHVTEQRVAVWVSAGGRRGVTSEHLRHTTHERRLATSGVRRESDDDGVERLREVGAARHGGKAGRNAQGRAAST